jgi:hypothetical protein
MDGSPTRALVLPFPIAKSRTQRSEVATTSEKAAAVKTGHPTAKLTAIPTAHHVRRCRLPLPRYTPPLQSVRPIRRPRHAADTGHAFPTIDGARPVHPNNRLNRPLAGH